MGNQRRRKGSGELREREEDEWGEEREWPGQSEEEKGGKERGGEAEERRRNGLDTRDPRATRRVFHPFSSEFLHFSGELHQTISWKTFYDLPSTHSISNLERFGVEIRKNAQKGAVALCVRFSHF